jgi:hypothetical protein
MPASLTRAELAQRIRFEQTLRGRILGHAIAKPFIDGTEITTGEGRLHLDSVLDMCSRRIVRFALGEHHHAELACGAVAMAWRSAAAPCPAWSSTLPWPYVLSARRADVGDITPRLPILAAALAGNSGLYYYELNRPPGLVLPRCRGGNGSGPPPSWEAGPRQRQSATPITPTCRRCCRRG